MEVREEASRTDGREESKIKERGGEKERKKERRTHRGAKESTSGKGREVRTESRREGKT